MLLPSRLHEQRGFSLIEITLALGIVSFCVIPVLGLSALTMNQTRESKRDVIWVSLAQEIVAKLEAAPWSTAPLPPQQFYFDIDGKAVLSTSPDRLYTCTATEIVGDIPAAPSGSSPYRKNIRLEMGVISSEKDKLVIPLLLSQYD